MHIYIGEQEYFFTQEELDYMYLDEGCEAKVYRFGSEVLKIYKPYPGKAFLNYETANILSKIPTTSYLLPKEFIYNDEKDFYGYTSDYKQKYSLRFLAKKSLADFHMDLFELLEDTNLLSENFIDIADLIMDNTIYDGHILICDPGSFLKVDDTTLKVLSEENKVKLNQYICEEILANIISLSKNKKQKLSEFAYNYDVIEEVQNDDSKTVGAFVKKITH